MPYVLFDSRTFEVHSAVTGPEPVPPTVNLRPGEVPDIQLEGALKNYVFIPEGPLPSARLARGRVERKPRNEWDVEAEEKARVHQQIRDRFHKLDIDEVKRLEVQLAILSRFRWLWDHEFPIEVVFEGVTVKPLLSQLTSIELPPSFEFGGHILRLPRTLVKFELLPREEFLRRTLDRELGRWDDVGRRLFTSRVLTQECLWFGLRLTNYLIERYRLAFGDWAERTIGLGDVLDAAVTIELMDGPRQAYTSGLAATRWIADQPPGIPGWAPAAKQAFEELLGLGALPFLPVAVAELKKANLYGQYRESVIWAGTIIANVIEDILLSRLPSDSPELRRLKNSGKKVDGATRRGAFFQKATGTTMAEWLHAREARGESPEGLAEEVERLLDQRNLLIHRKAAVTYQDGQRAFETCMAFLAAVDNIPWLGVKHPYEF